MKRIAPVLVVWLWLVGCQNTEKEPAATEQQVSASGQADTIVARKEVLSDLKTLNGQYPADVRLLDNALLEERLKTLLGADYIEFRKYWQTETPIVVEENVLSATGCEQHNCGANQYILQVDMQNDNINVYHLGRAPKQYFEKGPISLPPGLARDFRTLQDNTPVN